MVFRKSRIFTLIKNTAAWLLIAGMVAGCAPSAPVTGPVIVTPTPQPTATLQASTQVPVRPIYGPGTLVDYTVQSGDTLPALAAHFNTNKEEILEANPLISPTITTLQAGLEMKIPIYYKALWGSQFQILPDAHFVNGPAQQGFDTVAFVDSRPGWLREYTTFAGESMRRGGAIIDYIAQTFSISPRLLLALAEYETGALTQPVLATNQEEYPLGYADRDHKGFYLQLVFAANQLNNGFYGWRNGTLNEILLTDGTLQVPDPWQNAASVALQNYFSQKVSVQNYTRAIYHEGIYRTYTELFGDPWVGTQPHMPGNLTQPEFTLPFENGKKWAFTGGPHTAYGDGEPYAALDFAPPGVSGGCASSSEYVTAVADGQIVRTDKGIVVLDLDKDGDERTGWVIFYLHIGNNDKTRPGTLVTQGDPIGHPSCEGGSSTGTHVHIARKFNGEWMNAGGAMPFDFEGWVAYNGARPYLGTLRRIGSVITASEVSAPSSMITSGR